MTQMISSFNLGKVPGETLICEAIVLMTATLCHLKMTTHFWKIFPSHLKYVKHEMVTGNYACLHI